MKKRHRKRSEKKKLKNSSKEVAAISGSDLYLGDFANAKEPKKTSKKILKSSLNPKAKERPLKRHHTKLETNVCSCEGCFSQSKKEEILADFPSKVQAQNQYLLNLMFQFGKSNAETEEDLENLKYTIMGETICEWCLCVLYNISDYRYERVKNFYRVGAKVIEHGNNFRHHIVSEKTMQGQQWLENYFNLFGEPMPHDDIFHLHVPSKKAVFEEKPDYIETDTKSLYKYWDSKVKIPTKNQIFARCPQCQSLKKRCMEAGKCLPALEALKEERSKHKDLYMAEKQDYYARQIESVHQPEDLLCVIYDGMHKEKTRLPRFSANPSKDLETIQKLPCNLEGFICHRQDNADLILSCLVHLINTLAAPFPRNLSLQFDNASNNKCNTSIALFAYLVSEGIFHNVYGNTLIVNHTHEDVDRMFENTNEKLKRADMVTSHEVATLMMQVPYVQNVKEVPCVWDITSFLSPFLTTVHDFANVHHFWLHKNCEGNVVLHCKRYCKDTWLPDINDPKTYLTDDDKYGVLIFKEKPHGVPAVVPPHYTLSDQEMEKVKENSKKLFEHPLMQDDKLLSRKTWWEQYLSGNLLKSRDSDWPISDLKTKRKEQDTRNVEAGRSATIDVAYEESEMPLVYSGQYVDPLKKQKIIQEKEIVNRGEWPIKRVVKERTNHRSHKKEYLVEWKNSWVQGTDINQQCKDAWENQKKKKR
ncbi:uncharacterized protein LOC110252901 isoform X2 [Exaiptasia diaphana]|uniref:DUF7869 domain-containing protein n=1 Tax=Exaiptasia diaphana TaxID=2652724 RepID=A0A913Y764_EXADI|nr:uncharacterized protein LOC110252901 isoform X2 [Exaiptasia diaphana]